MSLDGLAFHGVVLTVLALIMRSMLPLIAMDRTFLETFGVEEGALAVVPVPH